MLLPKFDWLSGNLEIDRGHSLTSWIYLREMNIFFFCILHSICVTFVGPLDVSPFANFSQFLKHSGSYVLFIL